MDTARGGSTGRMEPTLGRGDATVATRRGSIGHSRQAKRLVVATAAALVALTATAAHAQDFRLTNPYTGNSVGVGTTDDSGVTLRNPLTGNTVAVGTINGSSASLTNPYTGNTVGEGTIEGSTLVIRNPYTGNTIAEGTLDADD